MHLLDIPAFVSFSVIVETGSLTAAAKRLGCSKAAVSRHLARVEQLAGTRLVNRTTRSISLTTAGQELYRNTVNLTGEVREVERLVTGMAGRPAGNLRITAPPIFVSSNVMELIPAFLRQFPDIQVDLTLTNRLLDPEKEPFDIAFRAGAIIDDTLVIEPIARYAMTICGSPEYFDRAGVPRSPQDLQKHECVLQTETPERDVWHLLDQDVRVTGRLRASTAQIVRRALLRGFGVGYVARFVVEEDILARRLSPVLEDFMPRDRAIYLAYPQSSRIPRKTSAFVEFIAEQVADRGLSWSPY